MTSKPDDPHARRAYRRELRNVARMLRWSGMALLVLGLAGLLLGNGEDWWTGPSWFSLVIGAALVFAGVVQRRRNGRGGMRDAS